jgi:broad specificity phosphatase PhoE
VLYSGQPEFRLWLSPYRRTRETADEIQGKLGYRVLDRREHILLCEQQFGLFDGIPDDQLPILFPNEHNHYDKCQKFGGRFWARMPLGESRFDVATRVHQAFGTFHRDAEKHGIRNLIIVAHGVTIRAFVMMWCHKTPEWFEDEPNPNNCSVREIVDNEDRGYIFPGFPRAAR